MSEKIGGHPEVKGSGEENMEIKKFTEGALRGVRFGLAAGATLGDSIEGAVKFLYEELPADFQRADYKSTRPVNSGPTFVESIVSKIKEGILKHIERLDASYDAQSRVDLGTVFDHKENESLTRQVKGYDVPQQAYSISQILGWVEADYK